MTNTTWEAFTPFAHIPNQYEICRIHSTTHGSFDCIIVIQTTTYEPVTVYVASDNGSHFMADRFPQSQAIQVSENQLKIETLAQDGRTVRGLLQTDEGSLRDLDLIFEADAKEIPQAVPYGSSEEYVWGSAFKCEGVDLVLNAKVSGKVFLSNGEQSIYTEQPLGLLALGSWGKLTKCYCRNEENLIQSGFCVCFYYLEYCK